jgi:hypothetical protein
VLKLKKIGDLDKFMRECMTDYYELLEDALKSLRRNAEEAELLDPVRAAWLLKKHEAWGNSSAGVALGYNLEAEKALKYLKKGREVSDERGDITTLSSKFSRIEGKQGKVLQLKHTLCKTPSAVDRALGKAILQISGHTKEMPENDDRLVIEMVISNMENSWPLLNNLGRTWVEWSYAYPLSMFEDVVSLKLMGLSGFGKVWPVKWEGKKGEIAQGIDRGSYRASPGEADDFKNFLKAIKPELAGVKFAQHSQPSVGEGLKGRLRSRMKKVIPEDLIPLPGLEEFATSSHMLIKIVYSTGRRFELPAGKEMALEKIVIGVRWVSGGGFQARVVKIKPI